MSPSVMDNVSVFVFVATYAIPPVLVQTLLASGWRPTLANAGCTCLETIVIIGWCMSVCLHRYCAHRAFKTSRPVQALIVLGGCFAYQGNPIWWASKHLRHHKYCDLVQDPHSWKQTNFFYAWVGWTMNPAEMRVDDQHVNHLNGYLELRVIGSLWWVWPLLVAFAIRVYCGAAQMVVHATTPMFLARMITLLFNVEYHPPHRQSRFDAACVALDIPRILGNCVGESCHADHHAHPTRARRPSGGFPYADVPFWTVIKPLLATGLAWSPTNS